MAAPILALMADARTKIGKLEAGGKVSADEAKSLLSAAAAAILATKPAYNRVGAWAQAALPGAPSGKVGAGSLPGGADWYAAALKLNTTLDLSAAQVHTIGLGEVSRIEAEQDALARAAGQADRHALERRSARRNSRRRPIPTSCARLTWMPRTRRLPATANCSPRAST